MRPAETNNPEHPAFQTPQKAELARRVYELECRVDELMSVVRLLANLVPEPTQDLVNAIALQNLRVAGFPLKINLPTGDRREMPQERVHHHDTYSNELRGTTGPPPPLTPDTTRPDPRVIGLPHLDDFRLDRVRAIEITGGDATYIVRLLGVEGWRRLYAQDKVSQDELETRMATLARYEQLEYHQH